MKHSLFLCLLFALAQTSLARQSNSKDSLKLLLLKPLPDSNRCRVLCKLGAQYMISDPDTALLYSQEGLALARRTGFAEGEIIGLNQTASIFNIIGDYAKALDFFLQALKKAESINNGFRMGASLLNIGSVYYYQGDFRTAVLYTLRAKEIFHALDDTGLIMTAALNLGDYYEKWNKLDSAIEYTQEAANLAVRQKDVDFLGMSFNNLGNIYSKMAQRDIALDFYRSGLQKLLAAGNDDAVYECTLGIAKLFADRAEADSCLYYAKMSMRSALQGGFNNRILKATEFLAVYYESLGKTDSAYHYFKASTAAKDSLFSQERLREIQSLTVNETLRQRDKQAEMMAARHERKITIQYLIIGIAIIVFVIIFLLLSQTIIVNEVWISFLGTLALLLVFEFINMILHPVISGVTHHSPFFMLLISVVIAALLIPFHHKGEHLIKERLVVKNKRHRLAAARRTVRKLGGDAKIGRLKS